MICVLCNELLLTVDKKRMIVGATTYYLHKKCIRSATQKELIEKGLISPNDRGWWTKL